MSRLGNKLFQILGDSEITANFQHLCGIQKHVDSKSIAVNGNSLAGFSNIGTSELENDEVFTENCKFMPEVNGSKDTRNSNNNQNIQFTNGVAKDEIIHRRNGYCHDTSAEERARTQSGSVTHAKENGLYRNGHGVEQTTLRDGHENTYHVQKYTVENRLLYYIFSFGAGLGNELFYIVFFSSTLWNFDSLVVRKLLIVWCVIMYVGQATKDVIKWPRPKSPPVVRLEDRYELEYGMPSTHAMVGVAIPFSMMVFMHGRYEFNYVLGLTIAVTWSLLVGLSRLYLGMHSILDIIAGVLYAVFLMSVTVPAVGPIDNFLMSHPAALPVTAAICITLCLLYPSLDRWSTARGDTTLVLGVVSGIYAGLWLTVKLVEIELVQDSPPYTLGLPTSTEASLVFFRQALGIVIVIVCLTCIKMTILHIICWCLKYDPKDPKTKQRLIVELPYRYISYYVSAVASTYLMPLLFLKFNIERPSYYSEIFNH